MRFGLLRGSRSRVVAQVAVFALVVGVAVTGESVVPLLGGVLAQQVRGAMDDPALTSDTPGTVVVSWELPSPAPTDYRIDWAKSAESFTSWRVDDGHVYPVGTETSVTVEGLDAGVEYKVRMRARYHKLEHAASPWSGSWTDDVVIAVAAEPVSDEQQNTEPEQNTDQQQGTEPVQGEESTDEQQGTEQQERSDQQQGTEQQGTEADKNADQQQGTEQQERSDQQQGADQQDDSEPVVPGSIGGLTASSPDPGSLAVVWDEPSPGPSDYRVTWHKAGTSAPSWRDTDRNAYTSFESITITGLDHDADYVVKIRARYRAPVHRPSWSGPFATTTARVSYGVPAAPTGAGFSGVTHQQATLRWDAPANSKVDGYRITRTTGDTAAVTVTADTGTASTEYTDTGLSPETAYSYQVTALNDQGAGTGSDARSVTTAAPAVDTALAAPTGVSVSFDSAGAVVLDWDDPQDAAAVTGYRILRGATAAGLEPLMRDTAGTDTDYTDHTATAGVTYVYAVRARTALTMSARSATVTVSTLAAPAGLGGYGATSGVGLVWHRAVDWTVTGYQILRGTTADSLTVLVDDTASLDNFHVDATAVPDTTYWYGLRARNRHGTGPLAPAVPINSAALPEPTLTLFEPETAQQSLSSLLLAVHNLARRVAPDGTVAVGNDGSGNYHSRATSFRTGSTPARLDLELLTFNTDVVSSTLVARVSIHASSGNRPSGDPLYVGYAAIAKDGSNGYADFPGYTPLQPNTPYWAVFEEVTGRGQYELHTVASNDQSSTHGWTIGDGTTSRDPLDTSPSWSSFANASAVFAIEGRPYAEDDIPMRNVITKDADNKTLVTREEIPAAPDPAQPPAGPTLISNIGQASRMGTTGPLFGNQGSVSADSQAGASFRTGNLTGGYTMSGVQVVVGHGTAGDVGDKGVVKAVLHQDASGSPGDVVATLAATTAEGLRGVLNLYATSPIALDPDTTYWVIFEMDHSASDNVFRIDVTRSNGEDHSGYGKVTGGNHVYGDRCGVWGFTIGSGTRARFSKSGSWSSASPFTPRMAVLGGAAAASSDTAHQPRCGDLPADTSTTGKITPDMGPAHGTHFDHTDVDWFEVTLEAGVDYEFLVRSNRSDNPFVLDVHDSSGTFLQTSEGVLRVSNLSHIYSEMQQRTPFKPASAGTYYVAVRTVKGGIQPERVYLVEAVTDDEPTATAADTLLEIDTTQAGPWTATSRIGIKSGGLPTSMSDYAAHSDRRPRSDTRPLETPDADWISVRMTGGIDYTLTYRINGCTDGTSRYLAVIQGVYTDTTTQSAAGTNSQCSTQMTYTPTSTDWYHVSVTSAGATIRNVRYSFDNAVQGTLTVTTD